MAALPDEQRERVLALARAGELSRNGIARELGIGASTVSRICRAAGLPSLNQRTARAVEVRQLSARQRRAEAADGLLDDLQHARASLWSSENARDLADTAKAISSLTTAHVKLATVDAEREEAEHTRSVLGGIAGALGLAPTGVEQ